jgi:hypothetical protein
MAHRCTGGPQSGLMPPDWLREPALDQALGCPRRPVGAHSPLGASEAKYHASSSRQRRDGRIAAIPG